MSKARYEIKFVLNELEFIEAKYFLKYINSFRSFPQREVTSLYYDTLDYSCVRDNLSGISKRKKLRLRWYNNFEEPKLEIKNRFSRVGNKKIFTLDFLSKKSFENLPVNVLSKLIFGYLKSKHKEDFIKQILDIGNLNEENQEYIIDNTNDLLNHLKPFLTFLDEFLEEVNEKRKARGKDKLNKQVYLKDIKEILETISKIEEKKSQNVKLPDGFTTLLEELKGIIETKINEI